MNIALVIVQTVVVIGIPLAPTLGNHEMYTLDWKMREPRA